MSMSIVAPSGRPLIGILKCVAFAISFLLPKSLYLVMTLQPGLIKMHANRKDVVQPGSKQSSVRDDAEKPTVRHTAMVATSESYTRSLPPPFWFKRHGEHLRRILSATGNGEVSQEFDDTAAAAEEPRRGGTTRDIKDVKEKSWEEELPGGSKIVIKDTNGNGAPSAASGAKKSKKGVSKEVAAAA